jgi:hypothetical protein
MIRGRGLLQGASLLCFVAVASCSDQSGSLAPGGGSRLQQFLIGPAAKSLDASGHFTFSPPAAGDRDIISQDQAENFAQALIRSTLSIGGLAGAEDERGTPIQWAELRVCPRTLYALSSWLPLEPSVLASPYGPAIQRGYGPYYLVSFCEGGAKPVLLIAVSAYSTDLSIENGMIVYPRVGGEWFHWRGIPPTQETELAVGPEQAVRYAAQLTGRKIAIVPDLIIPDRKDGGVIDARWRLQLDSTVTLKAQSSRQPRTVRTVYVGWSKHTSKPTLDVEVATSARDESFVYRTSVPKSLYETDTPVDRALARRQVDFPAQYETVASGDELAH